MWIVARGRLAQSTRQSVSPRSRSIRFRHVCPAGVVDTRYRRSPSAASTSVSGAVARCQTVVPSARLTISSNGSPAVPGVIIGAQASCRAGIARRSRRLQRTWPSSIERATVPSSRDQATSTSVAVKRAQDGPREVEGCCQVSWPSLASRAKTTDPIASSPTVVPSNLPAAGRTGTCSRLPGMPERHRKANGETGGPPSPPSADSSPRKVIDPNRTRMARASVGLGVPTRLPHRATAGARLAGLRSSREIGCPTRPGRTADGSSHHPKPLFAATLDRFGSDLRPQEWQFLRAFCRTVRPATLRRFSGRVPV